MRGLVSIHFLFLALSSTGLSEDSRLTRDPVYVSWPDANGLLDLCFPPNLRADFYYKSYAIRSNRFSPTTLSSIGHHYAEAYEPQEAYSAVVNFGRENLETFLLGVLGTNRLYFELLEKLPELADFFRKSASNNFPLTNVYEKLLLQRDIHNILASLVRVSSTARNLGQSNNIARLAADGAKAFMLLLCSREELRALRDRYPKFVAEGYSIHHDYDLNRNYLPEIVIKPRREWYEMPFEDGSAHFQIFGGCSFIHIYAKVPGMTRDEFYSFWDDIYQAHGSHLRVHKNVPRLPEGTEFILIRTIGVFDSELNYVDTYFPEEVLIRVLKFDRAKVDASTSDYRGTMQYQYKLDRRSLLRNPDTLGLVRVLDDEPSFYGFARSAPDRRHAERYGLMTVRHNCITCHGKILYGTSSVFSLGKKRKTSDANTLEWGMLHKRDTPSVFQLSSGVSTLLQCVGQTLSSGRE